MSFHIKYRPDNFENYQGNEEIIESLQKQLDNNNRSHCYLFCGDRGCGKTTLARIYAKKLDCEDIIEINSGNNRGIDTARDLIQAINFKSLTGKPKMYILDEVHRTTRDFQEAMLKPLEDTPEHVYFILCTTDPEKLIKTIRDRCECYELQKLNYKELTRLLTKISNNEKIKPNREIIKAIAQSCESNRQALIKFEQVIHIDNIEKAKKIIKSISDDDSTVIELCRLLLTADWKIIKEIVKKMDINNNNIESIRIAIINYMSNVLLNASKVEQGTKASVIIDNLEQPFYNSGKGGFVNALFSLFL